MPADNFNLPTPNPEHSEEIFDSQQTSEGIDDVVPWSSRDKTYARIPLKAINILGDMKEYKAQKLLLALCTFMDFNDHTCWPSYPTIMSRVGIRKNDIRPNLDLLIALKFIKVKKINKGGEGLSNFYTVTDIGYLPHLWEPELRATLPIVGVCAACTDPVRPGQYSGNIQGVNYHFGCGGQVILYVDKKQAERHRFKQPPV